MLESLSEVGSRITGPDSPFNIIDCFILVFLLYGLIRGLFRGFAAEAAGLVGSVVIFAGCWKYYRPLSEFLKENTRLENPALSQLVSYLLLIAIFLVSWNLINLILNKLFKLTFGKQVERLGGMVLGSAKCALITCIVLMTIGLTGHSFLQRHFIEESWFGSATQRTLPAKLHSWFPEWFDAPLPQETDRNAPPETDEKQPASGS